MKFTDTYIAHLQRIIEDVNVNPVVANAATQQINNAMSMLGGMDPNTLKQTGLDVKKKQLTDAVTQATINALTKVHTVLSGSFGSSI